MANDVSISALSSAVCSSSLEWRLASRAELLGCHHFQRRDMARPALRRPGRAGGCVLDAGLHPVHARLRPVDRDQPVGVRRQIHLVQPVPIADSAGDRSEEHTSELQSLMRISYAVFCLTKKKQKKIIL